MTDTVSRTYTKRRDLVVVDWAYHGNTSTLVEISPYKFQRKGGFPKPSYVHIMDTPDGYRGKYKYSNENAGPLYAQQIHQVITRMLMSDG